MTTTLEQTNETKAQEACKRLVDREVVYCVSGLVSMLAGNGGGGGGNDDAGSLCDQAMELASPLPDYEEAATDAGWEKIKDEFGVWCFVDKNDSQTWAGDDWEDLCREFDIEPYEREVYEHWIVSRWLADKLEERGEKVDRDFAGLTVWARTTTGQAILLDGVIREIVTDLGWLKAEAA